MNTINYWAGVALSICLYVVIWLVVAIPFDYVDFFKNLPLIQFGVPLLSSVIFTVLIMERLGVIRFIPELTAVLVVDEITSKMRALRAGLQFLVPWEKIEGNIFSLEQKTERFADIFETKDGSGVVIEFQIRLRPDDSTLGALATYNSLGADPMKLAFQEFGPAAGEVIQKVVASKKLDEIQGDPQGLRDEILQVIDNGKSIVEEKTGTSVVEARVAKINPDPATQDIQRYVLRLNAQISRAQALVSTSEKQISFKEAMQFAQIADAESKASAVRIRGGARGFFDFDSN